MGRLSPALKESTDDEYQVSGCARPGCGFTKLNRTSVYSAGPMVGPQLRRHAARRAKEGAGHGQFAGGFSANYSPGRILRRVR